MSVHDTITNQTRLAVLFDGDNISPKKIEAILNEITKLGTANIKRVYGDWTSSSMNSWKEILHKFSIQPIQQFSYTTGKNSTDSALIIDAMDILHDNVINGLCIVSSDSDYTRLATRMRESGQVVYGIGEKKTPEAFRQACDQFIFIENLEPEIQVERIPKEIMELLYSAVEDASDEEGWGLLSVIGILLRQKKPDFDHRTYGYKKLGEMFNSLDSFEIRLITMGPEGQSYPQIKRKE